MTGTQIIGVVASGTPERIGHWTDLLRQGGNSFEVRRSFDEPKPTRRNYAGRWVNRKQVTAARSIIRRDPAAIVPGFVDLSAPTKLPTVAQNHTYVRQLDSGGAHGSR